MFAASGATTADEHGLFRLLKGISSPGSGLDRKKETGPERLCQKIDKRDNSRK